MDALKFAIEKGSSVVLLSPLGSRPRATPSTGDGRPGHQRGRGATRELIFLSSSHGVLNDDGTPDTELARVDADALLAAGTLDEETSYFLQFASLAVKRGVARSPLLAGRQRAAGDLHPRRRGHHGGRGHAGRPAPATIDDVGAILSLIEPLEADGTLVPRRAA